MSGPYASTAHAYRRAGWAPLPLPTRAKAPVPEGWTGRTTAWPSGADVEEWVATRGDGNVGLRMPPTVLGIDVDAYPPKAGGLTLAVLERDLGVLPPTWRSTSRDDGTSGIRFYRVPAARRWPGVLGPGIETVRMEHRYAVAWPSLHPEGMTYRWLTPEGVPSLTIPLADALPALPQAWLDRFGSEALTDMPSAGLEQPETLAWISEHGGGQECEIVRRAVDTANRALEIGSRHEAALLGGNRLVWLAGEGHPGTARGLYSLRLAFLDAVKGDRPVDVAQAEWTRMLAGAVNLAAAAHPSVTGDPCKFQDLLPGGQPEPISAQRSSEPVLPPLPMRSAALPLRTLETALETPQEAPSVTESAQPVAVAQEDPAPAEDPLEAAWRASLAERFPRVDWHALWADESQEEWLHHPLVGRGRSVVIYSPPKVGKSLLLLELVVSLVTGTPWLGSTPSRPLRVLLLDFENSPRDDIRVRLRAMGVRPEDLDGLVLLSFPVMSGLDTARGAQELLAVVEIYQPDLVALDTVSRVIAGEENSNDTWLQVYRLVGLPLKALGIAVLRLDHTGKDEERGMRGGSAKYGDVDAVWRLSQIVPDSRYRLECTQSRMAMPTKHLDLERHTEPLGHTLRGALSQSPYEATVAQVWKMAEEEGIPVNSSRPAYREMVRRTPGLSASNDLLGDVMARRQAAGAMGSGLVHLGADWENPGSGTDPQRTTDVSQEDMPRSEPVRTRSGPERTEGLQAGPSAPQHQRSGVADGASGLGPGQWGWVAGRQRWIRPDGSLADAPQE